METKCIITLDLYEQWKVKYCPAISEEHKMLDNSGKILSLSIILTYSFIYSVIYYI